ncbi:hypothetical protein SLS60_006200 [Paraconiothyrium brasiliense]|uniref:Uncharacterized protein n=1 Tax=Paraconiothyrium brasiliense TaxID=300254 RepID=A0ABR3REA5_9PLEO
MEADLTEYINSNPAVEEKLRDETGVTAKAAVKAEHDLIFAALKGMPPLPSAFQLPVNSNVAQAVPTERPETIDRNDIAGFVTTKDLPRTVPTSLMKVDANGKEETRVDEEEEEAILLGVRQKVPGSRRRGWKRKVSEDVNLDDNVGRKHARHHQTKRPTSTKRGGGLGVKQKNSVLNALHEEQIVSSPASPNTTNSHVVASINLRQPKEPDRECRGSPASDRELEENKRKDLEAWLENLAIDTPPLAGNYLEKGAH